MLSLSHDMGLVKVWTTSLEGGWPTGLVGFPAIRFSQAQWPILAVTQYTQLVVSLQNDLLI